MEDFSSFLSQMLKVAASDYIVSIKGNRNLKVRKLRHAALTVIGRGKA